MYKEFWCEKKKRFENGLSNFVSCHDIKLCSIIADGHKVNPVAIADQEKKNVYPWYETSSEKYLNNIIGL